MRPSPEPANETLLLARGRLHLEIGQATQALDDLSAALERRPSAEGFTHRGLAYRQLCRFRDEVADYDRAIRLDPRFTQAYFERAFTNLFFDKRLDAIPDLSKVIALDPKNWMAYNFRGELYRYWVKLAPAIADYKQAVALNPGFAQAYCNMAFALRAARRMNEVDAWLAKCYALDPTEREVADHVFANIQAKEEQAARDMAAMRHWSGGHGGGGGGGGRGRRRGGRRPRVQLHELRGVQCRGGRRPLGGRADRIRPVHAQRVRLVRGTRGRTLRRIGRHARFCTTFRCACAAPLAGPCPAG